MFSGTRPSAAHVQSGVCLFGFRSRRSDHSERLLRMDRLPIEPSLNESKWGHPPKNFKDETLEEYIHHVHTTTKRHWLHCRAGFAKQDAIAILCRTVWCHAWDSSVVIIDQRKLNSQRWKPVCPGWIFFGKIMLPRLLASESVPIMSLAYWKWMKRNPGQEPPNLYEYQKLHPQKIVPRNLMGKNRRLHYEFRPVAINQNPAGCGNYHR